MCNTETDIDFNSMGISAVFIFDTTVNICTRWNAGTAYMSECVLDTLGPVEFKPLGHWLEFPEKAMESLGQKPETEYEDDLVYRD